MLAFGLGPVFRAKPKLGTHFWLAHYRDFGLGDKVQGPFPNPLLAHFQGPRPIPNLCPLSKPIIIIIINYY